MTCALAAVRGFLLRIACAGVALALSASASAQPANATLRVTVADQTGAVIVGATVTVTPAEPSANRPPIAAIKTGDSGAALIPSLRPGRYTVPVEFPRKGPRQALNLPPLAVRGAGNLRDPKGGPPLAVPALSIALT